MYVMYGNRDFLYRSGFEKTSGAKLIGDPTEVDLYGTRTLLMHGDTLCTDDVRYQAYRTRVRNPVNQWLFFLLPRFIRRGIAAKLRRASTQEKQVKRREILDVSISAVEATFREHRCNHLIHGHTHRPARHAHLVDGRDCQRWVLADWHSHGEYLRCDAAGWTVVKL